MKYIINKSSKNFCKGANEAIKDLNTIDEETLGAGFMYLLVAMCFLFCGCLWIKIIVDFLKITLN